MAESEETVLDEEICRLEALRDAAAGDPVLAERLQVVILRRRALAMMEGNRRPPCEQPPAEDGG